jgi:hypothetical protein
MNVTSMAMVKVTVLDHPLEGIRCVYKDELRPIVARFAVTICILMLLMAV